MQKKFTLNYFQPLEYQFSLDSIYFAKYVSDLYKKNPKLDNLRFLDLCCGCGVIGFEMYYYLRNIKYFDFVDIQDIYRSYFLKNLHLFSPIPHFNLIIDNYVNFSKFSASQYDVIVCNPPYFFPNEGILSSSQFKNRCRFFLDASFEDLIKSLVALLAPNGEAFVLISAGEAHGKNHVSELSHYIPSNCELSLLDKIRITNLVKIKKLT